MVVTVVLEPQTGVTASSFTRTWAADPRATAAATARVMSLANQDFDFGSVALHVVEILAGGIAGNALYDLIKDVCGMASPSVSREEVDVVPVSSDDGRIVVTVQVTRS